MLGSLVRLLLVGCVWNLPACDRGSGDSASALSKKQATQFLVELETSLERRGDALQAAIASDGHAMSTSTPPQDAQLASELEQKLKKLEDNGALSGVELTRAKRLQDELQSVGVYDASGGSGCRIQSRRAWRRDRETSKTLGRLGSLATVTDRIIQQRQSIRMLASQVSVCRASRPMAMQLRSDLAMIPGFERSSLS